MTYNYSNCKFPKLHRVATCLIKDKNKCCSLYNGERSWNKRLIFDEVNTVVELLQKRIETNIFWTRFSYAAGEIPTHPPSWTHLRKSTPGKTKEEVDRQRQGGLQPTGVDAHWSRRFDINGGASYATWAASERGLHLRRQGIKSSQVKWNTMSLPATFRWHAM